MSDVKWIKLYCDFYNHRKIKHIRKKFPEGNNIVLIWALLLCLAGKSNATGSLYFTDKIPYNIPLLATELDFPESIIALALETFQMLDMIEIIDDTISIVSWDDYQNTGKLDVIKEQNRIRARKYRENKKLLEYKNNVTSNVTVTLRNATESESESEIDKDKSESEIYMQKNIEKNSDSDPLISDLKKSLVNKLKNWKYTFKEAEKLIEELSLEVIKKLITTTESYNPTNKGAYLRKLINAHRTEVFKPVQYKTTAQPLPTRNECARPSREQIIHDLLEKNKYGEVQELCRLWKVNLKELRINEGL